MDRNCVTHLGITGRRGIKINSSDLNNDTRSMPEEKYNEKDGNFWNIKRKHANQLFSLTFRKQIEAYVAFLLNINFSRIHRKSLLL